MAAARFRIYYGDGSTYSGDPYFAPPHNVQVIAQQEGDQTVLLHGVQETKGTWYWDGQRWRPCDLPGLWDHLLMFVGPKAILFGRTVRDDVFWETVSRANREGLG